MKSYLLYGEKSDPEKSIVFRDSSLKEDPSTPYFPKLSKVDTLHDLLHRNRFRHQLGFVLFVARFRSLGSR